MGVTMIPNKNTLFVMLVGRATWFKAQWGQFFAKFNRFVVLTHVQVAKVPRCRDLAISFVENIDDNNDRTDYLYPLRMCVG